MRRPRLQHNRRRGQSLVEYLVLFAIVVVASVALAQRAPSIFGGYVSNATTAMGAGQ
jgi:uncharacterized protein (UPF0333 family)